MFIKNISVLKSGTFSRLYSAVFSVEPFSNSYIKRELLELCHSNVSGQISATITSGIWRFKSVAEVQRKIMRV